MYIVLNDQKIVVKGVWFEFRGVVYSSINTNSEYMKCISELKCRVSQLASVLRRRIFLNFEALKVFDAGVAITCENRAGILGSIRSYMDTIVTDVKFSVSEFLLNQKAFVKGCAAAEILVLINETEKGYNEAIGIFSDKPTKWITLKASISFVKTDNFCYTACPLMIGDRQCSKKVVRMGKARWHCERCSQEFEECDYRYVVQVAVQDHTGLTWVTALQESGEEILGISAKELYSLKYEEKDDLKFKEIICNSLFNQFLLKLKIKDELYDDGQTVKITVVKVEKVDSSSES